MDQTLSIAFAFDPCESRAISTGLAGCAGCDASPEYMVNQENDVRRGDRPCAIYIARFGYRQGCRSASKYVVNQIDDVGRCDGTGHINIARHTLGSTGVHGVTQTRIAHIAKFVTVFVFLTVVKVIRTVVIGITNAI